MAILFYILPLMFAAAQSQYIWSIPCRDAVQCASIMGASGVYQCSQGVCLCANLTTRAYEVCNNKDMMLMSKATGLRRNCTKTVDCEWITGADCIPKDPADKSSKICLCKTDKVESEDGQRCLPAISEIGGKCEEKAQCVSRLDAGAECFEGQCRCRADHHFKELKCVRNLGYGDHCKLNDDGCYAVNTPAGDNLLTCTETYGCRCKKHWTYNQGSQVCEFSGASQLIVPLATMSVLILLAALF